jgi:hypothetical protein
LYIDHMIGRLKAFAKDGIERHPCILGGDLESLTEITQPCVHTCDGLFICQLYLLPELLRGDG